jgi:hypothetical protein
MVTKLNYSRDLVRINPTKVFIFGDNTERHGKGGQACIRGLSNTLGVATKVNPSEFFTEDNWHKYKDIIDADLDKVEKMLSLPTHVTGYDAVILPINFIGTGLSSLPTVCPSLMTYLMFRFNVFMNLYGVELDGLYVPKSKDKEA